MTPKQQRFVEEYIVDLNAHRAALRAGYSAGTARTHGPRLLQRPHIARLVAEAKEARAARTRVTADRVVSELAKVAFGDPRRLFALGDKRIELRDLTELTEAEAALVSEITETRLKAGGTTRRVKLYCKLAALTALGKHLGLFAGTKNRPGGQDAAHGQDIEHTGDAREELARRISELAARMGTDDPAGGDQPG